MVLNTQTRTEEDLALILLDTADQLDVWAREIDKSTCSAIYTQIMHNKASEIRGKVISFVGITACSKC